MNKTIKAETEQAGPPDGAGGQRLEGCQFGASFDMVCRKLSDSVDILSRYDRRIALAPTEAERRFWLKLKDEELENTERLKRFVNGLREKTDRNDSSWSRIGRSGVIGQPTGC